MDKVKEITRDRVLFDDGSEIAFMGSASVSKRFREGWWLPKANTHAGCEIQAIRTGSNTNNNYNNIVKRDVFPDDESAKDFVTKRAQEGSQYHQAILLMLAHRNLVK